MLAGFLSVAEQVQLEELVTTVIEWLYQEDPKYAWITLSPSGEEPVKVEAFFQSETGPSEALLSIYPIPKGVSRENLVALLAHRIGQVLILSSLDMELAARPGHGFLLQEDHLFCQTCGGRVRTLVFERGLNDQVVTRCLSCDRDETVAL